MTLNHGILRLFGLVLMDIHSIRAGKDLYSDGALYETVGILGRYHLKRTLNECRARLLRIVGKRILAVDSTQKTQWQKCRALI